MEILLFKAVSESFKDDTYYQYLTENGFSVTIIPPIDFEYCNIENFSKLLNNPDSYAGIIFTSLRSVKAVQLASPESSNLEKWTHLPAFVVGESTEKAARALGFSSDGKETGSAQGLADMILKEAALVTKPLLYPKGNLASDNFEITLKNGNIPVSSLNVYNTVPHSLLKQHLSTIEDKDSVKMVFFSPSGVDIILPELTKRKFDFQNVQFYAIGETTERSLISHGISVKARSSKPSPEALMSALNQ